MGLSRNSTRYNNAVANDGPVTQVTSSSHHHDAAGRCQATLPQSLPKRHWLGAVGFHMTETGDTALREDFEAEKLRYNRNILGCG
jgi:hypothetical protein